MSYDYNFSREIKREVPTEPNTTQSPDSVPKVKNLMITTLLGKLKERYLLSYPKICPSLHIILEVINPEHLHIIFVHSFHLNKHGSTRGDI